MVTGWVVIHLSPVGRHLTTDAMRGISWKERQTWHVQHLDFLCLNHQDVLKQVFKTPLCVKGIELLWPSLMGNQLQWVTNQDCFCGLNLQINYLPAENTPKEHRFAHTKYFNAGHLGRTLQVIKFSSWKHETVASSSRRGKLLCFRYLSSSQECTSCRSQHNWTSSIWWGTHCKLCL